jgi:hypothetical protein
LAQYLEKIFSNVSTGREAMRKRNKKTTIISKMELTQFTEQILAGMGEEGKKLRDRLMQFLAERMIPPHEAMRKTNSG